MSWLNLERTSILGAALAALVLASSAHAQGVPEEVEAPGVRALEQFRAGRPRHDAIENRFFLKQKRFETSVHFGYVPNNSFAARYVGGLVLNYHLSETIAVGADILYSPDMNTRDLKPLVGILLDRAQQVGGNEDFQQPLDKVTLAAVFGVTWAPIYGKINLIGETVLNFDFYGYAGLGMVSKNRYYATYNPVDNPVRPTDVVSLSAQGNAVFPAPTIGVGQNYFISQMMAVKLDLKTSFYIDKKPQYDVAQPVNEDQLYNNLVVSVGIGAFFPKMKPRLYDF